MELRSEQALLTTSLGSPGVKPSWPVALHRVSALDCPSPASISLKVCSLGGRPSSFSRSTKCGVPALLTQRSISPLLPALIYFLFYNKVISQAVGFLKFIIGHNKKLQVNVELSNHVAWATGSDTVGTWGSQTGPTGHLLRMSVMGEPEVVGRRQGLIVHICTTGGSPLQRLVGVQRSIYWKGSTDNSGHHCSLLIFF